VVLSEESRRAKQHADQVAGSVIVGVAGVLAWCFGLGWVTLITAVFLICAWCWPQPKQKAALPSADAVAAQLRAEKRRRRQLDMQTWDRAFEFLEKSK
jgi:hypothetical protein